MEMSNSLKLLTHWPEMDIYHLWTHIWDNMRENLGEIIAGWGRLGLENRGTCEERSDFIWPKRIWKRLSVLLYSQIWGLDRKPKGLWGLLWSKTLGLDPRIKATQILPSPLCFDVVSARGQACPILFQQYCWTLTCFFTVINTGNMGPWKNEAKEKPWWDSAVDIVHSTGPLSIHFNSTRL